MKERKTYETIGLMMRVLRMHRCRCEQKLSELCVHHSQHRMIMYLNSKGKPVTQKDLAEHFDISPAAASVTVSKLEKGGYVSRVTSENNLRQYDVELTDKGKEIAKCSREIFNNIDSTMVSGITDAQLEVFRECLEKMICNFERSKQ